MLSHPPLSPAKASSQVSQGRRRDKQRISPGILWIAICQGTVTPPYRNPVIQLRSSRSQHPSGHSLLMPSIPDPSGLTALITFILPASRLDHDQAIYLDYDPKVNRPTESIRVAMTDLRPELEIQTPVAEQLDQRGFAIAKHRSDLLDSIPSEEGTQSYLDETAE